jgi:hypothetical protein
LGGELANRGEPVAGAQPAGRCMPPDLAEELKIDWSTGASVQLKSRETSCWRRHIVLIVSWMRRQWKGRNLEHASPNTSPMTRSPRECRYETTRHDAFSGTHASRKQTLTWRRRQR